VNRILLVDSEPQILRLLRINLTARQYRVLCATTGGAALRAASNEHPDLIMLDLSLPDMDGVQVIRQLRTWTPVPIIVLSWRGESGDKVNALDAGADDYVTKPFSVEELLARIRSVTRRQPEDALAHAIRIGRYHVDLVKHGVEAADGTGHSLHLTRTEWRLLEALVSRPGKLISQRQLLMQVWGPTYCRETQYIRQYIAQLRRKFEIDPTRPRYLLTEPGLGYRYQP
jgi:two-component system KDP operon response regulator KdpE